MSWTPPPPPPSSPPPGWPPPAPPGPPGPPWATPPGWGVAPGALPPGGWAAPPAAPGSGRFRAQAVGELLDSAFTLYRRNFRLLIAITAVVQVPLALFSYLAYQLTGYSDAVTRISQLNTGSPLTQQQLADLRSPLLTLLAVSMAVLLVQLLLVQPLATAAMTRAVGDIYVDAPTSLTAVYAAVGRRLGAVVGVAALLLVAGIGMAVAATVVVVVAVLAIGAAGVALLILVVPAIVFGAIVVYTRWLFAAPTVILEHLGPVQALRRSWRLVLGSTGRVFGITLLVGLITGILSAAVGALLSVVTQAGDPNLRLVLDQLATLVVAVLIQPISFIVVVLLYYDLRIRREAFDIEMLAATL